MGNSVFPTLPGLGFSVTKKPQFITKIQKSVNGRELRAKFSDSPLWTISLTFEFLRDNVSLNELKTLGGFFFSRYGSWDSFLFADPDDSAASNMQFGVGDGVTKVFQLSRTYGTFTEPVTAFSTFGQVGSALMWSNNSATFWPRTNSTPLMWSGPNGLETPYVSASGVVTFTKPPVAGQKLYWTGVYYYRCRFLHDEQEYEKFMYQLWTNKKCDLYGSLGNKI
jgi:hypothetical protein